MRGYAVVDIETTGFSYKHGHRIVEIGVVELSLSLIHISEPTRPY